MKNSIRVNSDEIDSRSTWQAQRIIMTSWWRGSTGQWWLPLTNGSVMRSFDASLIVSLLLVYWTNSQVAGESCSHTIMPLLFAISFSITIPIRCKIRFSVIRFLVGISLQNFAHVTTDLLSCHVQKLMRSVPYNLYESQMKISRIFELWWKNC